MEDYELDAYIEAKMRMEMHEKAKNLVYLAGGGIPTGPGPDITSVAYNGSYTYPLDAVKKWKEEKGLESFSIDSPLDQSGIIVNKRNSDTNYFLCKYTPKGTYYSLRWTAALRGIHTYDKTVIENQYVYTVYPEIAIRQMWLFTFVIKPLILFVEKWGYKWKINSAYRYPSGSNSEINMANFKREYLSSEKYGIRGSTFPGCKGIIRSDHSRGLAVDFIVTSDKPSVRQSRELNAQLYKFILLGAIPNFPPLNAFHQILLEWNENEEAASTSWVHIALKDHAKVAAHPTTSAFMVQNIKNSIYSKISPLSYLQSYKSSLPIVQNGDFAKARDNVMKGLGNFKKGLGFLFERINGELTKSSQAKAAQSIKNVIYSKP